MATVPRSRWLTLVVAALLCLLGGANRGQVPAHDREGSRTADEPAALSSRRLDGDSRAVVRTDHVAVAVDVARLGRARAIAVRPPTIHARAGARQLIRRPDGARGPPQRASV
jgi:hypothetical protein